ncbi:glycosyltransferase family 2 protein [uncultured Modestobacter sp.]|uniref:glycosyltransferase family 2 protein n=1 Tax=uncultured Modestobacter sp. TaxID=380048 RepID=UPI0026183EF8|nr:glycosyltransferase family 2 protein [uncultured Modestobacter sp.]
MSIPRDAAPLVSVVICAYTEDRWDDVLAAVASVRAQSLEPDEVILVVDHNPALHARLRAELPDVLVIENRETRGLSGGKNTGVATAKGELIAFLDDDAVAEPDWLKFLVNGFADPEVLGVGGTTLPLWATRRPAWFPEEFDWVLGCTYTGREPGPVRNLLGGNACFRRSVFAVAGGFPVDMGRTSGNSRPLGCEETEFCIRASHRIPGAVFVYEPRAVIGHRVSSARQRFAYFRSRCYAEGLSKAAVTRSVGVADGLSAERDYTIGALRRGVGRGLAQAAHGDLAGLRRAGAIAVGLGAAGMGYARGTIDGRRQGVPVGAAP